MQTCVKSVVAYPTLRGLTWNGETVNFEYKRHKKRWYMLHGYHYDTGQYEQYMRPFNLVGIFRDSLMNGQRQYRNLSKCMSNTAKTIDINKGIKMENTFC